MQRKHPNEIHLNRVYNIAAHVAHCFCAVSQTATTTTDINTSENSYIIMNKPKTVGARGPEKQEEGRAE